MAIKNIEQRKIQSSAKEETVGITRDGFYDPTGEFPRRAYKNSNTINRASRGLETNEVNITGGDPNAPINTSFVQNSIYPHNQAQETASGHVIEIDDTIGNERIMIKHRTGAGIEIKPDGSVIVSSVTNTIQLSGADQTVIVEGNGKLVYKGNLDLNVKGDLTTNIGGDYNLTIGGDRTETIKHNNTTTIIQDETVNVKGNSYKNIQDDSRLYVGGSVREYIGWDQTLSVGRDYTISVKDDYVVDAEHVDQSFDSGTIGGDVVDFTGRTFTGFTFHGDLDGTANASLSSNITADSGGSGGHTVTNYARSHSPDLLDDSDRTVTVPTLDVYTDSDSIPFINYTPTVAEARALLRTSTARGNVKLTDALVLNNIISPEFSSTSAPSAVRTAGSTLSARKGVTPIGTNPPTFDKKSFKW